MERIIGYDKQKKRVKDNMMMVVDGGGSGKVRSFTIPVSKLAYQNAEGSVLGMFDEDGGKVLCLNQDGFMNKHMAVIGDSCDRQSFIISNLLQVAKRNFRERMWK